MSTEVRCLLRRHYQDGVVVFDRINGRTYAIPPNHFPIVELIDTLIATGLSSPDALLARAIEELDERDVLGPSPLEVDNLRRWIAVALRFQQ